MYEDINMSKAIMAINEQNRQFENNKSFDNQFENKK